jgi:hypothetical protein
MPTADAIDRFSQENKIATKNVRQLRNLANTARRAREDAASLNRPGWAERAEIAEHAFARAAASYGFQTEWRENRPTLKIGKRTVYLPN